MLYSTIKIATPKYNQIFGGRPCGAVATLTGYELINASIPWIPVSRTNFSKGWYISFGSSDLKISEKAIFSNPGISIWFEGSKTVLRAQEYKMYLDFFKSSTVYKPRRSSSLKTCSLISHYWSQIRGLQSRPDLNKSSIAMTDSFFRRSLPILVGAKKRMYSNMSFPKRFQKNSIPFIYFSRFRKYTNQNFSLKTLI